MSFDADVMFNNAAREIETFHSAFGTDTVHSPTAVADSTCMAGGEPSHGSPPTTPLSLTRARSPSARSARRIARDASNPAE